MTFLNHLKTLSEEEVEGELEGRISEVLRDLPNDELASEIASTNATGWGLDVMEITSVDLKSQADRGFVRVAFEIRGDQDDDKPFSGTSIHGEALATIFPEGHIQLSNVRARRDLGFDEDDEIYEDFEFEQTCKLVVPDFQQINLELIEHFSRHPEDLQKLDWRKFEELLDAIFKNQGYETILGPGRSDKGIDLRLLRKDSIGQMLTLVQARRYSPKNPIRLEAVAALSAMVDDEGANRGLFVTTSRFLPGVHQFAEKHQRKLILAAPAEIAEWCRGIAKH
jgi:hypothetical protein